MSVFKSASVLALSSVIVMLCQALTIHLYARMLSVEELADYMVVMSLSLSMTPFLSLGVPDGVLYFVGRERDNALKSLQTLTTGLFFMLVVGLTALLVLLFTAEKFSGAFFSVSGRGILISIAALLALSRYTYNAFVRYLTAVRRVKLPGITDIVIMGIFPLAVILVGQPLKLEWLVLETAVGTFLLWFAFYGAEFFRGQGLLAALRPDFSLLRPLVGYGVQRIPAIAGMILLLSTPVVIARKLDFPVDDVVVVGASMALIRMIGVTNQLMTRIVLPRIAWARENSPDLLGSTMWMLVAVSFVAGLAIAAGFVATGDTVLGIWLHRSTEGIGHVSLPFWMSAFPFIAIFFLRPTIDALHYRAYGTVNVFAGVCMMIAVIAVMHFGFQSPHSIGVGVLSGSLLLCGLNVFTVFKLTGNFHLPDLAAAAPRLLLVSAASLMLIGVSLFVRSWEAGARGWIPYAGIVLMGCASGAYLVFAALPIQRAWSRTVSTRRAAKELMEATPCS